MSGGKQQKAKTMPVQQAGPEPAYQPLPPFLGGGNTQQFQSLPNQNELVAQQLHQGYPSMDQAALLAQLQGIYKPVQMNAREKAFREAGGVDAATAAAAANAKQASAGMSDAERNYWRNYRGKGYGQGAMFEMPSDLLKFLSAQGGR